MLSKRVCLHSITATVLVWSTIASPRALPAAPAADWAGWSDSLTVLVRNNAATALPSAYTVQLTLDTAALIGAGSMQPDCDDLRISRTDGATDTELDRLVEGCNTATTVVRFRTQAGIPVGGMDTTYRLRYGNPIAANPPADRRNVYAFFDDFEDGDAAGWSQKGVWSVVDDGGNHIYRYTGGGANWALSWVTLAGLTDLDYVAKIRATNSPMTNWIGLAFRIQDQNNFLTFYQSRDTNQFKYARVTNDNHTIVQSPSFSMAGGAWHWLRVQAIGNQVRARIWQDGSAEPAGWLISASETAFQSASNIGLTLYNHTTNADWDDVSVSRLADVAPTVAIYTEQAPWWDTAWGYRAQLTVDNPSASEAARSRYSARVALDTAGPIGSGQMRSDCQDLRVVSFDGISNLELDRLVTGCNTTTTEVWFALPRAIGPTGHDSGYSLYYGNPVAGAPPANSMNVFLFHEDWEQGAGHWTNAGGLDPANTGTLGLSVISDAEAVSPSHSQMFPQKRAGGDAFSGYIPVSPNTGYAIGVWGKSATNAYAPVGFDPYTAGYANLGEVWLWTSEWTVGPQWSYRSARFTSGSSVAYLKIKSEWWSDGPGTAPVYMDDLTLRYANAVEPIVTPGDEESLLPSLVITDIADNGPVELGNAVQVSAVLSATQEAVSSATLRILAPEVADVPMSLTSGNALNGVWGASFTPQQGGVYTYRILGWAGSRPRLSAARTFTALDTIPPQITLLNIIDPILVKSTQTVTVTVTDNGRVDRVRLTVPGATYTLTHHSGDLYSHSWPVTQAGTITYTIVATDTAGNAASLTGSFESRPPEIEVCAWQDCKPGAASWSNDDSNSNCKMDLESAGFRGTYYVNGSSPQSWYADYSAAGHEIGAHTVSHPCYGACCGGACTPESIWQCPYTVTDVVSYRQTQFEPNVQAIETATGQPVLSGAWPCGCTDPARMIAGSYYFLGVRGYSDCGCAWVQDNNEPTPIEFMNLNGLHHYEQIYIDRAIAEGKWTIVTSHGSCDGISYMGSRRDALWAAPVGEVLKYIKVRNAARFSNYARAGREIRFDAAHNLSVFQRQKVDETFFLPVVFDNPVTLKARLLITDTVLDVRVDGAPVSFTVRSIDGARFVLFDAALHTLRHVVITLSAPAPTVDAVSDNGPVELGNLARVTATVSVSEGAVHSVTLRLTSPAPAEYPMSLTAGATNTYAVEFTPGAPGTYTYSVAAANADGATGQSAPRSFVVRDTTPPQWRAQSQSMDALHAGQTNLLSIEGYDAGGLHLAVLHTDESGAWQAFDWPVSNWWNHQWAYRRAITLTESAGLARAAEMIDLAISALEFPGLTDCAAELRVADANRIEAPSQVYDARIESGVLNCRLVFPATVEANASRAYYVYYGNPAAAPPTYTTDLTAASAGNLMTVRSAAFDLDLDKAGGIISRIRLPAGNNINLPLSSSSAPYWGWHQVCSSLHGNIAGKNMQCVGGGAPASGLVFATLHDGPLSKAFAFTSLKGAATYTVTYRFFAGAPYYAYTLERAGADAAVMNNFWYANGNFAPLGAGLTPAPPTVYNSYSLGADHVRIASLVPVSYTLIDGGDNDGTQIGGYDYRYPTAPGLSLFVATGSSQPAAEAVIARLASPIGAQMGDVEHAPQGRYGSPFDAQGATAWTTITFTWQNPAIPAGSIVRWRVRGCDQSANCVTSDEMSFQIGQPPPLPSRFFGEVHALDNPPTTGDTVEAWIAGIDAPFTTTLASHGSVLAYQIDVPGDLTDTPGKEGGVEGDIITFTIGQRIMAIGDWHSGDNVQLDLHPPRAALAFTPPAVEGAPVVFTAAGSDDWGHDIVIYEFDCDADGVFESGMQAAPTTECLFADDGAYTVTVRLRDGQGGMGAASLTVTVTDALPTHVSAGGPYTVTAGQAIVLTGTAACAPTDGCAPGWVVNGVVYSGSSVSVTWLTSGNYSATFRVADDDGNIIEDTASIHVLPVERAIALQAGWNLISFDVLPSDTSVAAVLATLDRAFDLVYAWDGAAQGWRKFDPAAPAYANTLHRLDHTMGFWVRLTAPRALTVTGDAPAATDIRVYAGWNLVGYPSASTMALPGVLQDHGLGTHFTLVYAYHAGDPGNPWRLFDRTAGIPGDLTALSPGWGYWIRVSTGEHIWTVPPSAP